MSKDESKKAAIWGGIVMVVISLLGVLAANTLSVADIPEIKEDVDNLQKWQLRHEREHGKELRDLMEEMKKHNKNVHEGGK